KLISKTAAPATGVRWTEHFLKDLGEEVPVDQFTDILQVVEFGQGPALLVLFKQVAFIHLVTRGLHRKRNV
ncbi:MAG: hypothetical protein OXH57_03230, partial [Ekhidna sp.]|nr:hypothetical protein [Ekhidna sp.]